VGRGLWGPLLLRENWDRVNPHIIVLGPLSSATIFINRKKRVKRGIQAKPGVKQLDRTKLLSMLCSFDNLQDYTVLFMEPRGSDTEI
jgi:hypothetical protein